MHEPENMYQKLKKTLTRL